MSRFLIALAAVTAAALPVRAEPPSSAYEILDGYSGNTISGTGSGTHTLTPQPGVTASTSISGGSSPVLIAQGSVEHEAYMRMSASYTYSVNLVSISDTAATALQNAFNTARGEGTLNDIIAHVSGKLMVLGTSNTDASIGIQASSENGSDGFQAGCEGQYCYGLSNFAYGVPVDYSFALHASAFGYGCDPDITVQCVITPGTQAFTNLMMSIHAGVGYTSDTDGQFVAGSIYVMLDPTVTLDNDFFSNNGLNINDYATSAEVEASDVPEPATWAMMVGGFAVMGGALRRKKVKASLC